MAPVASDRCSVRSGILPMHSDRCRLSGRSGKPRTPSGRRRWAWLLLGVLLVPLAAGCSGGDTASGVDPLARAEGWRAGLFEEVGDRYDTVLEVAWDREAAERAWAENVPDDLPDQRGAPYQPGRYGSLVDVDFDTQAVVVWSAGSTSCPEWLHGLRTSDDTIRATTREQVENGCADISIPYRMVVAVDRELLPDPAALPTAELTIEGSRSVWPALVTTYPAGG